MGDYTINYYEGNALKLSLYPMVWKSGVQNIRPTRVQEKSRSLFD